MWNGNQRGSTMISTGITGTPVHGTAPKSASRLRVKTLLCEAPPCDRIQPRAFFIYGSSVPTPIIFSA